ncbi:MAG TPA: thiamine pyrophosphate-binding protein [Methylomirabilota bacterium]|nr:thiamine pyrophosphate-binding protein [Methylomirabilota bacterium]
MADLNGGHLVARTLRQAGVGHVFTLCGGHILPIYDGCLTEGVAVVDMRHEQACAHAADAYARLTRNVGVALVTAGPGVTDAVTGIANAHSARSPVLLIGGAAPLGLRGLGSLQEVEQVDLLRPITKGSWTVSETRQIPEVLTTAIRHALTGRPGPVFVEIPVDLLMTVIEDRMAPIPTAYAHRRPTAPDDASVAELAALLGRAERPVIMAGSGVYWDDAAGDLAALAERAGVSRAAVYLHFASRGEVVGALFDYVSELERREALVQPVHDAADAVAALDAFARLEATYHARILGVARAIENIGREDPDAAGWRLRLETYQIALCQLLARRLADEHRLAAGWTTESAADMLWALMATEPLERLLHNRGWTEEDYAERFGRLLRATFVAPAEPVIGSADITPTIDLAN